MRADRMQAWGRLALMLSVALASLSVSPAASAEDAATAYARGESEFSEKKYAEAAHSFAHADALSPHPDALAAALKASILADDPALGMELVERANARPSDVRIQQNASLALELFRSRTGKLTVLCELPCEITEGPRSIPIATRVWMRSGNHSLTVKQASGTRSFPVDVLADGVTEFVVPPMGVNQEPAGIGDPVGEPKDRNGPEPNPTKPDSAPSGLSPVLFFVGLGFTAAAGAVTIGTGVAALDYNEKYLNEQDDAAKEPGQRLQLVSNIFVAITAASAITTVVFAATANWHQAPAPRVSLKLGVTAATLGIHF